MFEKCQNFSLQSQRLKKKFWFLKNQIRPEPKKGLQKALKGLKKAGTAVWGNQGQLNKILASVVKENAGLENGDVFWPVRAALSGMMQSPSPVELLQILGREKSLKRLKKAIGEL